LSRLLPVPGDTAKPRLRAAEKEPDMLKVIEILSESEKSWEDAAANAVKQAAKTIHNIKSIYIENMEANVRDDKIVSYRINGKISFLLDGQKK
jgi:flavin-binding protein dodecin